jgi:sulfur carrier protein ThiS
MKRVTLLLTGPLRDYAKSGEITIEAADGATFEDIAGSLGIPPDDITGFFINGVRHLEHQVPADGDRIEVLPAILGG